MYIVYYTFTKFRLRRNFWNAATVLSQRVSVYMCVVTTGTKDELTEKINPEPDTVR